MLLSNHRGVDINMNDIMKEKHGFTLVELLAVIVVLAIIMLIAVQAVMPLLQDARKKAFVTEAQAAIDAAQAYYMSQALSNNVTVGKGICIEIKTLIDKGFYATKREGYEGWVEINAKTDNPNDYLYKITMTNGQYYVKGGGVKDQSNEAINPDDDVKEGDSTALGTKPATTACTWLGK